MESWFCEEDIRASEFIKLLKILKRNCSEESGYVSDESDMVTGTSTTNPKYQISPLDSHCSQNLEVSRLSPENLPKSDDNISFLDISNFLSKCCINSTCLHSKNNNQNHSDRSDSNEPNKLQFEPQKYDCDKGACKRKNPSSKRMSEKSTASTSIAEGRNPQEEIIIDFESSDEVLRLGEQHKANKSEAVKVDSKSAPSSSAKASKKDENVEEKSVMVPTGK